MKIYIETLGCPKNTSDSEAAAGILLRAGHSLTGLPGEADVILVNTCGFIQDAKEESIRTLFELASIKKEGGILAVSGCLSQRYGEQLFREMPEGDLFIGVNDYEDLPRLLNKCLKEGRTRQIQGFSGTYRETGPRVRFGPAHTALLKISEGCDNRCAYCVIPSIRGNFRSRAREAVLEEARRLAEEGCRELILIAQDVTHYGSDLYKDYGLPELLRELCAIPAIRWIRLMYCYEDRITDSLIRVMAEEEKICRYIDLPLQHCSDPVLRRMRRRSTQQSIRNTIGRLREAMPDIHIRTTFIVGFPGETGEDFEELCRFAEEMEFSRLGVFAYSREENTPAARMDGQVRKDTRERRKNRLMELQREISLRHNQAKIGRILEVLAEEPDGDPRDGVWLGRTRYDAPEIDNGVIFTTSRTLRPGDMVRVRITDGFDYDLAGTEEVSAAPEAKAPASPETTTGKTR